MKEYDVIIIGTGPAGMLAALEFVEKGKGSKILMIEKGPVRKITEEENNLFGWGGAGAFSDGKLTLTHETGGQLIERGCVNTAEFDDLMRYVDGIFEKFGGKQAIKFGDKQNIANLLRTASSAGLELVPYPIKHWGREGAYSLVESIREYLLKKGVTIAVNSEATLIERTSGKFVISVSDGHKFSSKFLILAPGRAGADWLGKEMERLGVKTQNNPVDLGVRIEVANSLIDNLTSSLYDFKIRYITRQRRDLVRTFCVCPSGVVIMEKHSDYTTVNGQTYQNQKSKNTNFSILVSMPFTEPFQDPNAYGRHIAKVATLLADNSVLVQTLADFQNNRRSRKKSIEEFFVKPTLLQAAPGDLRLALPERFIAAISEMIEALDKVIPGINNGNNALLYGVEAKFYSRRVALKKNLETSVDNLYVIGDGSGYTRGILQSAMMGVIVAKDIINK